MAFELGFSESFFWGDDEDERYTKRQRPTNVASALVSMSQHNWKRMCKQVFNCEPAYVDIETAIAKIQETNTCTDLTPPVEVWIDKEGYWTVKVWNKRRSRHNG